jgi:hypothetical protein
MFSISAVQTFQGASSFLISGIGDMEMGLYGGNMMLFAATRAGGGIVAIDIDAGMALADSQTYTSTAQLPVGATLDIVSISGYPFLVVSGSYQSSLLTYRIEPTGTIGGFLRPSGGPMGAISAQAFVTVGGQTYLYANTGQRQLDPRLSDGGQRHPDASAGPAPGRGHPGRGVQRDAGPDGGRPDLAGGGVDRRRPAGAAGGGRATGG